MKNKRKNIIQDALGRKRGKYRRIKEVNSWAIVTIKSLKEMGFNYA